MTKQNAYERHYCIVCGKPLKHKPTGRPRRFCDDACKQKDYRELKAWVSAANDAALAGEPDPPKTWRWEVRVGLRAGRQSLVTEKV